MNRTVRFDDGHELTVSHADINPGLIPGLSKARAIAEALYPGHRVTEVGPAQPDPGEIECPECLEMFVPRDETYIQHCSAECVAAANVG